MQLTKEQLSPTKIKLKMAADAEMLKRTKDQTLRALSRNMKVAGFRPGKIPLPVIEKNLDPAALQSEFVERVLNQLYGAALDEYKLRPAAQPQADVKKFVPFDTLEAELEVEVIGDIKLPDYKKIKLEREAVEVTDEDMDNVLKQLRIREATKNDVERAAKDGDQVWIDFKGVDPKTKKPVKGADGTQYPLVLGSDTFIPGFEPALVGLKAGEQKTFEVTFPADYGVSALRKKKVEFTVTVTRVQEVVEPELNDDFAALIGPFKNLDELKKDIRGQVEYEKQNRADRDLENKLLDEIVDKAKAEIPVKLIDDEVDRLEREERQSLMYRGQTWQDHLEQEGVSEAEHREKKRPEAERRVRAGLVLGEIAEAEKIDVTLEELNQRLDALRAQYQDKQMQAELDKPEARREITSRLVTEKTIAKLVKYATSK